MNIIKKLFRKKAKAHELCDLTVLRPDCYPCEKCSINDDSYCSKLIFHDRTICVIPMECADKVKLLKKPSNKH